MVVFPLVIIGTVEKIVVEMIDDASLSRAELSGINVVGAVRD